MLKKFTGVLLSAALIVSAVGALTALPTTAASGSFTPQHMKVDFSDYVINDDTVGKANNTYTAKNITSGTETSKTIWQIGEDSGNKYIYTITNSKVCNDSNPANGLYTFILNPTGKAGDSKSGNNITADDAIYKLEDGVRYRMTFRYKFQNWDKNTTGEYNTEVKVKVGASATGVCGWNDGGARFKLQDGETALALQNTTEWKTAEFEFVANMSQGSSWGGTWMDSMMVAFIPYKVGTSTIKARTSFNLYLDDFVVDRVASANIVKNGAAETVYGAPACENEYRTGFGTCGADKISTVSTNGNTVELTALYSDAELTIPATDAVFSATSADTYYAKAITPKKTEVYESTTANTGYAVGTNVFGTGFADIKANFAKNSGASNFKEGFIIWTQTLLGDKTLDVSCVTDEDTSALKIETSIIDSTDALNDALYGVLKCRDVTDGKVSERYAGTVYVARPFVSYELDGVTYYVYGNTETTSVEG